MKTVGSSATLAGRLVIERLSGNWPTVGDLLKDLLQGSEVGKICKITLPFADLVEVKWFLYSLKLRISFAT